MTHILLVDPRGRFGGTLVAALEQRNHVVHLVTTTEDALNHLHGDAVRFDVVIIDISANHQSDWETLDSIRIATITDIIKPMVLCISDRSVGPEVRLDVEGKGARLVVLP